MSLVLRKPVFGVSDTNRAMQSQKMARALKFWIYKVEGSYYLSSENKDAGQLRGYQKAGFLITRLINNINDAGHHQSKTKSSSSESFHFTAGED